MTQKAIIEGWRRENNESRPHMALKLKDRIDGMRVEFRYGGRIRKSIDLLDPDPNIPTDATTRWRVSY